MFHKLYEKQIKKILTFEVAGLIFIRRHFEKKGIILNKKQISEIEKNLRKYKGGSFSISIDLDNDQSKLSGIPKTENIAIDLGDISQELGSIFQELVDKFNESIPELIIEMSLPFLSSLKKSAPSMLKRRRSEYKSFEKRVRNNWKKAFDLYEMYLEVAYETGEQFNHQFRNDEEEKENLVLEVLTRLHARACQIASEILVLIKSGYADGAHARWRSLHELAVVSAFINKHGNETAQRYLLHNNIESFKAANLYQKHYLTLGDDPMTEEEYASVKNAYDQLIIRFGNSYKNEYGWASFALNKEKPNFSDIEENSGLDYLRPYYKLASHNVHANPKGLTFKLGLLAEGEEVLLAGPSNTGFTDPAQGAVISLGRITRELINSKPDLDSLVTSEILLRLEAEIGEEFLKIQMKIEKEEAQYYDKIRKYKKSKANK